MVFITLLPLQFWSSEVSIALTHWDVESSSFHFNPGSWRPRCWAFPPPNPKTETISVFLEFRGVTSSSSSIIEANRISFSEANEIILPSHTICFSTNALTGTDNSFCNVHQIRTSKVYTNKIVDKTSINVHVNGIHCSHFTPPLDCQQLLLFLSVLFHLFIDSRIASGALFLTCSESHSAKEIWSKNFYERYRVT